MGAFGFEKFIENGMPNDYCYYVNIKELADKYIRETGRQPVVVVDGPNSLRMVLCDRNDQHWILGGQLKEFVETTKRFVCCFKNIGVDLKFVFGSNVSEDKKDTWINRRNEDIDHVVELFQNLMNQCDYSANYRMPAILGALARFVTKYESGCDTEVTLDRQDVAIARYAHENKIFGILSQDTDYIFMDGARYYFSLKHLNLDSMETVIYDREGIKRILNLQQHELLLLPPLLGCETLPWSNLSQFQDRICPCKYKFHDALKLVRNVVKFIKEKNIQKNENFDYLHEIALDVFGTEEKAQDLEMCIRGYLHEPMRNQREDAPLSELTPPERKWNEILKMAKEKHKNCTVTAYLYPVMLKQEYELSIALENYSDTGLVSTARAYLPLRQRIYGILLYEKPDTSFVKELCIEGMRCPTEASRVPIKQITDIDNYHPGLRELWNDDCSIDMRWNLFVQSLTENNKVNAASLKELGFPYAVPVAVLYYLVQEKKEMLKEMEIDIILVQAAAVSHYTADDLKAMRNQLNSGYKDIPRVVEIATIFLRGVTMVLFLLAACGFPLREAMPWFYFDGKLLLQKYIQGIKERKRPEELCTDTNIQMNVYSTYKKMKNLVMPIRSWR